MEDIRAYTDKLLGEVYEFINEAVCTDSVAFQGSRQSMEESLVQLKEAAASYGTGGILPGVVDGKLSSQLFRSILTAWRSLKKLEQWIHCPGYLRIDVRWWQTYQHNVYQKVFGMK